MIEPGEVIAFAAAIVGLFLCCADRRGRAAIWRQLCIWIPEFAGLASILAMVPLIALCAVAMGVKP
jgi:hypothetical protein